MGFLIFLYLLNSARLRYINYKVGNVAIDGENNYKVISVPEGHNYLFANVTYWGSCSKVFTLVGSYKTFYIIADKGTTISDLQVRLWYME